MWGAHEFLHMSLHSGGAGDDTQLVEIDCFASSRTLGRKTYLVDMAEGNRRTDYVAVSNTVIGALLLLTGALGAAAALVSVPGTVLLLGLCGLIGAAMSLRLKEVSG